MSRTFTNLLTHIVFSTKDRMPVIEEQLRPELYAYLGGLTRELKGRSYGINGTADHVHMLIRVRPAQTLADVMRVVKTNSSRWARRKWKAGFAWQTGYGSFSVSESNVPAVCRYVANQEQHHRTRSFQEEFVVFLKNNKISYDERYIWE